MAFGLMGTSTVSAEITYLWGVDYIARWWDEDQKKVESEKRRCSNYIRLSDYAEGEDHVLESGGGVVARCNYFGPGIGNGYACDAELAGNIEIYGGDISSKCVEDMDSYGYDENQRCGDRALIPGAPVFFEFF